eukprot:8806564-Ditylum_brightwellii.AAC.1
MAMNNHFACDTLQQLKPTTQFDVDPVRHIVCCEDNDMNHYIAFHQVQCFEWLLKDPLEKRPLLIRNFLLKVQDKTKELNYDTLQCSVDKSSINNYLWVNSSKVDDTRIGV